MSKTILIEFAGGTKEIALMDDSRLLFYEKEHAAGIEAEQIYACRADRIMKGMEAAFVQLGKDQAGFLPFSECRSIPRSGQKLLVQVKKPPIGEKAAYLTEDIAIAGKYGILTPFSPHCAVSRKITDESEQKRLLSAAQRIRPADMGVILRTESAGVDEETLKRELMELNAKWAGIFEAYQAASSPCLLQERADALRRLLRDEHGQIAEIITNRPDLIEEASLPVRFSENVFALMNVRSKLQKSWQRKIWLDCGGFLVVDKTEAMTVIDVNSGKFAGLKGGTENSFLKLNLEAAREIARLLRLRGVGGIILIDFVDMALPESRETILTAFQEALQDDPAPCVVYGFTALGLMEMTRKKTADSQFPVPLCPQGHEKEPQEE